MLTFARQSETVAFQEAWMDVAMQIKIAAATLFALTGILLMPATGAQAQGAGTQLAQARTSAEEFSAQRRIRRPPTRIRVYPRYVPDADGVYPRYFPGRNAVRDCTASYVQEFRPSGTVIVPRMNCFWRPG